jgi:hypothetical protein
MLLWMFFQLCLPYYHGANNCCKNLSMHSVQIIGAEIVQKKVHKWPKNAAKIVKKKHQIIFVLQEQQPC